MATGPSYIIIGAGVFGVSTALRLIQTKPSAQVLLIDRVILNRESASWDWSKIIRADYTDILYCRLALEARQSWRTEPLYREFYHETGLIWVDQTGFSEKVVTNYANLGVEEKLRMVPVETLRKIEGGLFESADFGTNDMVYVNDCSGWVEAYKALERITESAATAGVQLVESNISRLTFDANGNCTGAQSTDGESFLAQNIILATGAETARLLVESAPSHLKLHAGNRLRAAGLITGVVRLDSEEAIRHRAAPAFLHAEGQAKGAIIPPNSENELKVTRDTSFTNRTEIAPGHIMSVPPADPIHLNTILLEKMKSELSITAEGILGGRGRNMKFEDCRICWDAITPTQDFIISAHPHAKNLYIATGGSFHSWKYLPTLGKYVEQMLENRLDPELAKRWGWDREELQEANQRMVPSYDIITLKK